MILVDYQEKLEALGRFQIESETQIASYYNIRQELDKLGVQFRNYLTKSQYLIPFLQPGRLIKVSLTKSLLTLEKVQKKSDFSLKMPFQILFPCTLPIIYHWKVKIFLPEVIVMVIIAFSGKRIVTLPPRSFTLNLFVAFYLNIYIFFKIR